MILILRRPRPMSNKTESRTVWQLVSVIYADYGGKNACLCNSCFKKRGSNPFSQAR